MSENEEVPPVQKALVLGTIGILLAGAFFTLAYYSSRKQMASDEAAAERIRRELPDNFVMLIDEPRDEWEHTFAATLSSLSCHNGYNPLFVLEDGALDGHQLWTLRNSAMGDWPVLLFSNDSSVMHNVSRQVENVTAYDMDPDVVSSFLGFDGRISVSSYREALWASSVCSRENKLMVMGDATFSTQEECYWRLLGSGRNAEYVILTNPRDYRDGIYGEFLDPFNIRSLSLMSSQLAARHEAYVITDVIPSGEPVGDLYPEDSGEAHWNDWQIGALGKIKELDFRFGPVEYVALVGSVAAVPHFFVADYSGGGNVSSDIIYGFLDDDPYSMDAAVGRIINFNVQGASNQMVRTLGYDLVDDEIEVLKSAGGAEKVRWRQHGSVWNGFEVADQRLQMSPGWYMKDDLEDEGFSWDYMRTTGNEGYRDVMTGKEIDFQPIMESSGVVFYRGHGSHHATMYVYEPDETYDKGRLEGYVEDPDLSSSVYDVDSVHHYQLPPQIGAFISCLNAKAHGYDSDGPIDMKEFFSINYMYGGAIGLFGATEVSYSNLGQDVLQFQGPVTGNYHWDKNNAWYAFLADGLLDHEEEHGSLGKMLQWAENRYMNNPNKDYRVSPLVHGGDSVDWREVTFFCLLGDPAFRMPQPRAGANDFDPWHNGEEDK